MPKGINKHGSNELAKAYVHGRLDEARDVGIAKLEKRLTKKLFLWANNIGIHPLELKSLMGTLSVSTEGNHLSGAGMQLSTSGSGEHNSGATMEGAGLPYVGGSRGDDGRSHGSSPDAPSQVALPTPKRRGVAAWVNEDGSRMTPEQRKEESRRRMLKRNDPMAKTILGLTGQNKNTQWEGQTEEERLKEQIARFKKREQPLSTTHAKMLATMQDKLAMLTKSKKKALDAARHREYRTKLKAATAKAPKNHGKRNAESQKIYLLRSKLRSQGVPEDQLPPLPSAESGFVIGRNGHKYKVKTPEEKAAIHRRHMERHEAKKKGLPVPPLLSETVPEPSVN